jgi:hypothetical protein
MVRLGSCFVLLAMAAGAESGPRYVGSKVCFGCHADIYRSFTKTAMGHSMRTPSDLGQSAIPADATVAAASEGHTLRVFHDDSGWYQSEQEANVFVDKHKLAYVIGSGANGLTPIVRRGEHLFQAPLSYYSKIGKWDLSPGYKHADLGFSRPVELECVLCHSGRPAPLADRSGAYADPPFQELAIGCENCHGPGEFHAREPTRRGSIVDPAKLAPRLAENICLNCHQGGDARVLQPGKSDLDFRPGQWLIDTVAIFKVRAMTKDSDLLEHHSAMKLSRCFRESGGKLSCLTCHDPHVEPSAAEAPAYFRTKCLTCHTEDGCRLPKKARAADDCVGCHMPKRSVAMISHSALTNHRIPARRDEPFPQSQSPEGDDLLLVDPAEGRKAAIPDITILQAYSEVAALDPKYQQRFLELLDQLARVQPKTPFVQAALGHKLLAEGKAAQALPHLSLGMALDEVTIYEDMAKALAAVGRDEEALECLRQATTDHPFDAVLMKMLTLQYIKLKRFAEARDQMQRYVELFPEDPFMRGLLARVTK